MKKHNTNLLCLISLLSLFLIIAGCGGGGASTVNPVNPVNPSNPSPTNIPAPTATTPPSDNTFTITTENIIDNSTVPNANITFNGNNYVSANPIPIPLAKTSYQAIISSGTTYTRTDWINPTNQTIKLIPSTHNMDQFWALVKLVNYLTDEVYNENNSIRWTQAPHFVIFQQMEDGTDVTAHANQFADCLQTVIDYNISLICNITFEFKNQKPSEYPNWTILNPETGSGYIKNEGEIGVFVSDKLPTNIGGIASASYHESSSTYCYGGIAIWNYTTPDSDLFRKICYHELLHTLGFSGHPNENTDNWEISVMNQKNAAGNYNDQSNTPSTSDIENLTILYNRDPAMTPPDNNANIPASKNPKDLKTIIHSDNLE